MAHDVQADQIVFAGPLLAASRRPERRLDDYPQVTLDKLQWVLGHARAQNALPIFLGAFMQRGNDVQAWFLSRMIRVLRQHLDAGGLLPRVSAAPSPKTHEDDTALDVLQSAAVIARLPRFGVNTIVTHRTGVRLALGCSGPQAELPRNALTGLEDEAVDAVLWLSVRQWNFVQGESFDAIPHCALAIDAQEDLLSDVPTRRQGETFWMGLSPLARTQPRERAIQPWILQGDVVRLAQGVAPVSLPLWDGRGVDATVFDLAGLRESASPGDRGATASLFADEMSQQVDAKGFHESEDSLLADARLFLAQNAAPETAQSLFDALFERAKARQKNAETRPTEADPFVREPL